MDLIDQFQNYIQEKNLFQKKDFLLVGVSGGVDSVVLCELLHRCGFQFSIAHCNFQLRGEESLRDETFVIELANRYGSPLFINRLDTEKYATENKVSIQVAARELRYQWFHQLLEENKSCSNGSYILTAHHLNDSIETMLMNFFKGTGIKGMKGIDSKHGRLVRPLVKFKKSTLLAFADTHQLPFVEDSSNLTDKYTRNFLRHQVMPIIEKIYPQVEDNLADNLIRFQETVLLFDETILNHKKKLTEVRGEEVFIPILKLKKEKALNTLIFELIKDYAFNTNQVNEVRKLMESETGKYIESATHKIIRNRAWLIISPKRTEQSNYFSIDKDIRTVKFTKGVLHFKLTDRLPENWQSLSPDTIYLDADIIQYPMLLRPWQVRDYFYPLGMNGKKKKVGKFLSDSKINPVDKQNVWVLQSGLKILWVVGSRIDERFKVTPRTTQYLQITMGS